MADYRPRRIGVLHHPKLPQSLLLADEVAAFLGERGCASRVASSWDTPAVRALLGEVDLFLTLGGDGTILRTARMSAAAGTPVMGVNLGRVGFLAELQPGDWRDGLARVLDGEAWLEVRMMLRSEHRRAGLALASYVSLNEVVVGRGRLARVIRIAAHVDGAQLSQYVADGLIAATPTGSTAYAFAAGGPIMPPTLRNILLVPIAPMFGLARPVVLSEGAEVVLTVDTDHEAILTVDGQSEVALASGDQVSICASEHTTTFARVRPTSYFYDSLSERLRYR
ncbi:MAG: NAD(+)/NADH kinase [Anaerolineae bacterium]